MVSHHGLASNVAHHLVGVSGLSRFWLRSGAIKVNSQAPMLPLLPIAWVFGR